MIAAVQQNIFPDMATCCKTWVDPHLGDMTKPDGQLARIYDQTFLSYVNVRQAMRPVWPIRSGEQT
jgi:erythritol kinase (D-erythritol 1-phosphate-forming)